MAHKRKAVQRLYGKLLSLYPHAFRERLGESMQQTFDDLYHERQRETAPGMFGFVLWIFLETAIGVCRERLLHIRQGDFMQTITKTHGPAVLISFLLILPFMLMEVVNRPTPHEEFPVMLFFGMWLTLFAVCLILLPIVRVRWIENPDLAHPVPAQGNTLLTNPRSAAVMSIALILSLGVLLVLRQLFIGSNPEQSYLLLDAIIGIGSSAFPIAAGIIAGGPIVRTLRAGGSLFAHPLHLLIVVLISSLLTLGFVFLIIDQWPCFIGVPNCD